MLKLSQVKKHVYTHAEIIGNGYPEQWSKAQAFATHLAALQEKVLPTLPHTTQRPLRVWKPRGFCCGSQSRDNRSSSRVLYASFSSSVKKDESIRANHLSR